MMLVCIQRRLGRILRLPVFVEGFEGSNKGIKFSVRDSGGRGCVGGGEMDQAVGGGARGMGRETRGWVDKVMPWGIRQRAPCAFASKVKGLTKGLRKLDGWVKLPGSIELVDGGVDVVVLMGIDITIDRIAEVRIIEAIGIREMIRFKWVRRVHVMGTNMPGRTTKRTRIMLLMK